MLRHRVHQRNPVKIIVAMTFLTLAACSGCRETDVVAPRLAAVGSAPIFVSSYPPAGGIGPYRDLYTPDATPGAPHCYVQFNEEMDWNSFQYPNAMQCTGGAKTYEVGLYNGVSGSPLTAWPDIIPLTIFDQHTGPLTYQIGTTYTVSIDTSVRDLNGVRLQQRALFSFTPEPKLRVVQSSPAQGDTVSPEYTAVEIFFNSEVSLAESTFIHVSPPLNGGQWLIPGVNQHSASAFYRGYASAYIPGTVYTITVDKGLKDAAGHVLETGYAASFAVTAGAFRLTYAAPDSGTGGVSIDRWIFADFTLPVDTSTIAQGIVITPPIHDTFVPFESELYSGTTHDLIPDTLYTVTFTKNLKSTNGASLSNPRTVTFRTGVFTVGDYSPSSSLYGTARSTSIGVGFTGIVDTTLYSGAFSITPAVAGHFTYSTPAHYANFVPDALLQPGTEYDVKISTALHSASGYALDHPLEFTFTTGTQ